MKRDRNQLNQGTQIAYLPNHACGDIKHPDVEFGFVMMQVVDGAFCRFWRKGELGVLRTTANSEKCLYENLVLYTSVPQKLVDQTLTKIWNAILD